MARMARNSSYVFRWLKLLSIAKNYNNKKNVNQ